MDPRHVCKKVIERKWYGRIEAFRGQSMQSLEVCMIDWYKSVCNQIE